MPIRRHTRADGEDRSIGSGNGEGASGFTQVAGADAGIVKAGSRTRGAHSSLRR